MKHDFDDNEARIGPIPAVHDDVVRLVNCLAPVKPAEKPGAGQGNFSRMIAERLADLD